MEDRLGGADGYTRTAAPAPLVVVGDVARELLDLESDLPEVVHPENDVVAVAFDAQEHESASVSRYVRPEDVGFEVVLGDKCVCHRFEHVALVEIDPVLRFHFNDLLP